jgi:hypothetical protein
VVLLDPQGTDNGFVQVWGSLAKRRSSPQVSDATVGCPAESVGNGFPLWLSPEAQLGRSGYRPGCASFVLAGVSAGDREDTHVAVACCTRVAYRDRGRRRRR